MAIASQRRVRSKGPNRTQNKVQGPIVNEENRVAVVSDKYETGWDFILANGPVDEKLYAGIIKEISNVKNKSVVLCLITYGGLANDAFRIGKALQLVYSDICVFVPSYCKSAGTLIACAGNSISMSPFGELGPLDVQLLKRDELFERRSGLITTYTLEELKNHSFELFEHFMIGIKHRGPTISFKMASEIASKITADLMKNVYDHINVESIGEDARNLAIASEYCMRLDQKFSNLKPGGIDELVHGYASHDFVIDSEEAIKLFQRVERPTKTLYKILTENRSDMVVPRSNGDHLVKMLKNPNVTDETDGQETANHENQKDISTKPGHINPTEPDSKPEQS